MNIDFFSKKSFSKLLVILTSICLYFGFKNLRFESIDYFLRDSLQYLNSPSEVESSLATLTINLNLNDKSGKDLLNPKHGTKEIVDIVQRLQKLKPKNIILMMEPLDFSNNKNEKIELFNFLSGQKNLFLNMHEARNELLTFAKDEVFKNFERPITFDRCMDSPKDRESRRAFLAFNDLGQAQIFEQLPLLGYEPVPISSIKYKFNYWNTLQAYIKSYRLGTYGNYQSNDLIAGNFPPDTFKNKTVIVGTNDEFSMLTSKSPFSFQNNRFQDTIQQTRIPIQDVFANILNFHITGNYIKFLQQFDDLAVFCTLFILIFLTKTRITHKIFLLFSILPAILIFEILIYSIGSYYIDFSRSLVCLILVQYFSIPILLFFYFRKNEAKRLKDLTDARIDALLTVATSVAHDLRSPLSTITLLISKAHFSKIEESNLVNSAIEALNATIENILKKNSELPDIHLENINFKSLLNQVISEKKFKEPDVKFLVEIENDTSFQADENIIRRILDNILDNATQALNGQSDKIISIYSKFEKNNVIIIFEDNGPGISSSVLSLIGKKSVTTKLGLKGNGLGLLNSSRMVEKMGGTLSVTSTKTRGTTVKISMPIRNR